MKKVCTGFFNVLANKTRLSILYSLQDGERSVNEIVESTGHEQSLISHNLKLLKECNFVLMRVNGKQRMYDLNKETIAPLFELASKHMESMCDGEKGPCPHTK